ncbi:uncharacterized protein LOC121375849 [Gigantopelta aegis]|uniref:uncharacterized protein LOC121375849 n=1 Tax=Gigantopelta aegis TaxID=1735272 RepID=UPI001B88C05A|nr:uncharacterized protein LOC121375849 [Gigantopelta aegis]
MLIYYFLLAIAVLSSATKKKTVGGKKRYILIAVTFLWSAVSKSETASRYARVVSRKRPSLQRVVNKATSSQYYMSICAQCHSPSYSPDGGRDILKQGKWTWIFGVV